MNLEEKNQRIMNLMKQETQENPRAIQLEVLSLSAPSLTSPSLGSQDEYSLLVRASSFSLRAIRVVLEILLILLIHDLSSSEDSC